MSVCRRTHRAAICRTPFKKALLHFECKSRLPEAEGKTRLIRARRAPGFKRLGSAHLPRGPSALRSIAVGARIVKNALRLVVGSAIREVGESERLCCQPNLKTRMQVQVPSLPALALKLKRQAVPARVKVPSLLQCSNPSLNRTRNGVPRLGLISFWPRRVTPLRAG